MDAASCRRVRMMTMRLAVEGLRVIANVGGVVMAMSSAAGIVIAVGTAGVPVAVGIVVEPDVRIAVDPAVVATAVAVIIDIGGSVAAIERVINTGREKDGGECSQSEG